MTFLVRVAAHPDPLVSLLCDELATPLDGPFSPEVVAVPTRGIERWLTQRIASSLPGLGAGDGICANVEFPSPRLLVRDVLLTVPALEESVAAWQDPELTAHVTASIDANLDRTVDAAARPIPRRRRAGSVQSEPPCGSREDLSPVLGVCTSTTRHDPLMGRW